MNIKGAAFTLSEKSSYTDQASMWRVPCEVHGLVRRDLEQGVVYCRCKKITQGRALIFLSITHIEFFYSTHVANTSSDTTNNYVFLW